MYVTLGCSSLEVPLPPMMLLENEDCDPIDQRFEQMLQKYDVGNPRIQMNMSYMTRRKSNQQINKSTRYTGSIWIGSSYHCTSSLHHRWDSPRSPSPRHWAREPMARRDWCTTYKSIVSINCQYSYIIESNKYFFWLRMAVSRRKNLDQPPNIYNL